MTDHQAAASRPGSGTLTAESRSGPSRARRLLAGVVAALALVLAAAGPAAAHATLVRTDPSDGSVLAAQPAVIAAQFDESVGVSADSLRVFSPSGQRVDNGNTAHGAQDDIVTIALRSGLGNGTYTVAWHVISADSHPVSGAFSFSIGAPSRTTVDPNAIVTRAGAFAGVAYGVARWAAYLSFALLAGAVVFLALCWPAGAVARGALRLIIAGWTALVASSVLELLLQGVYASGLPLSRIFDPSVIQSTAATRFGTLIEIRVLALALAAPAAAIGVQRLTEAGLAARLRSASIALVVTMGLAATWAGTGHASTGIQVPLSVASDILHLTAMSVWLGGLAMLSLVALRIPEPHAPVRVKQAASAVNRFSTVALACVCVMISTGTYQAWRDVGSLHILFGETYGRLILVKIAGLLVLVGFGYLARRLIASGVNASLSATAPAAPSASGTTGTAGTTSESAATRSAGTPGPAVAAAKDRDEVLTSSIDTRDGSGTIREPAALTRVSAAVAGSRASGRPARRPGMNKPGRRTARVGGVPRPGGTVSESSATLAILRRLRRSVAAESAVVLVVLAVTAVVVASVPGRGANGLSNQPGSTDISLPFDTGTASGTMLVLVEPGKVGPNQTHVLIENTKGEPYSPVAVSIAYSLPARKLGPIDAKVIATGPGHYIDQSVVLSVAGQWQVSITIRSDDFDETTVRVPVPVS
ncbi:copper resistance protein CopC/CopD [Actinocrinis puniceicyclus]|uniref:Copper resistance protein CopC/CopD n=1 Tax=Actinocrinis puniceicyclus TaxID=977794 RepID=A0A8J8BCV0_9ACTN|nr:copper resistance protein CopC [Actinocrinis puniceicyclus]MBS2963895.1 copper resistance protein CopC/CopD [Actinocrinis puniceicyclus]